MRQIRAAVAAAALALAAAAAPAQDAFSAVIAVGDRAVTGWEIEQRLRLLEAFDTPGDLEAVAREQLVEERLMQIEFDRVGIELTEEGLALALEEFAARAGMPYAEFAAQLGAAGVAEAALRDYIEVNVTWRDYIRARFAERIDVTEAEIDQWLAQRATEAEGVEVLLSEIVIPVPPGAEAEAEALARELARITDEATFAEAARAHSATASRDQGGRIDWLPLTNFPPPLRQVLLELEPGEVTPPLGLGGAIAVLQLRDLRQGAVPAAEPAAVEFAALRLPAGAEAEAARLAAEADRCDDLYDLTPPGALDRRSLPPAELPAEVALAAARLDPDEASWAPAADGSLLFVMLCARTYPLPEGAADRGAARSAILSQRLEGYASALLAELRAGTAIVGE